MLETLTFAPNYLGLAITLNLIMFFIISRIRFASQIKKYFLALLTILSLWCISDIIQVILPEFAEERIIIFEYCRYIFSRMTVILILLTSLNYDKRFNTFAKAYFLLFLIPIISIILSSINNLQNLFQKDFILIKAIATNITAYDWYLTADTIFLYIVVIIAAINLLYSIIKRYGAISKQCLSIVIGNILIIFANSSWLFAGIGIENATSLMPTIYTIGILLYAFVLFSFRFLEISSIALKKIVDTMSDGYIILNKGGNIVDYNRTLVKFLKFGQIHIKGMHIERFLATMLEMTEYEISEILRVIEKTTYSTQTVQFQKQLSKLKKHVRIELTSMFNKEGYAGTLILLKDITQHIEDMNKIKENQMVLMEKERLAVLGQLIGGIAHNLKTPIMSISGACEGIKDLVTEYEKSVSDEGVTVEDHHEIAGEIRSWVNKIRTYTEYMSDVITTVKGQAVALSEQPNEVFTVRELMKRVDILMKHELKNALIELKIDVKISDLVNISGNINSLIQIVNNIISNSIQSYQGRKQEVIWVTVDRENANKLVISIKDEGCGIPEKIQTKLLKEMITTKGKDGTGLGLYMSYSNIKAHFGGDIKFESEEGKGTIFYIYLPI